jgi:hypothetical protein
MMLDLTLWLATPIAQVVMDKFFGSAASKLGEQTIDGLPQKVKDGVQRLGQLLWQRGLSQKPNGEPLLQQAAAGSATHQQELKDAIAEILADSEVMQQAQQLATEIHQTITIAHQEGKNQMNVFGGQGLQVNKKQDQPIIQIQGNPIMVV